MIPRKALREATFDPNHTEGTGVFPVLPSSEEFRSAKELSAGMPATEITASAGIPNFAWINRNLPITEVARRLGLRLGTNGLIHCWHPDRHHNNDRTASVGVRKTNNTVKCFGCACELGPIGPIDLVVDVMRLDSPAQAGLWIAEHFEVPTIPKRKHLKEPPRRIVRAGFEGDFGLLVQSGLWSRLSPPARAIVPVFLQFAQREDSRPIYHVQISYRAISRYSGIKSSNAVAKGVGELEEIHWLTRQRQESGSPIKAVNSYVVTPESDELMELAHAMAAQMRNEIKVERELRSQQQAERRKSLTEAHNIVPKLAFTKYKTLYSANTANRVQGIPQIPRIRARSRSSQLGTASQGRRCRMKTRSRNGDDSTR